MSILFIIYPNVRGYRELNKYIFLQRKKSKNHIISKKYAVKFQIKRENFFFLVEI